MQDLVRVNLVVGAGRGGRRSDRTQRTEKLFVISSVFGYPK